MKRTFTLSMIFIFTQVSFAQESKLWLSLGAGTANTNNASKTNLIGNGYSVQGDAFVPFYKKGWDGTVKGSSFEMGVNLSGNYTSVKNLSPNDSEVANQYQIFGGNLSVATQSTAKRSGSFSGLLGLQGRISFGKFNLSPSVNTGYLNLKREGYTQNGVATVNGQTQQKELIKVDEEKTNGLLFKPQLRVGYDIAPKLTVFLGSSISIGPEIMQTTQYLVPQGGFNDRKTYEASQLAKGTWESKATASRYNITEFNFGLTMALGKKKPVKGETGLGSGTGAASASYARRATNNSKKENKAQDSVSKSPLYEAPVGGGVNPMFERKSTPQKQTQGKTFGEKMANGLQVEDKDKGQNNAESSQAVNGGVRTYTGGRKNEAEGRSISEKGVKRSAQGMAKPGTPIGGIVVKGGKNPGGNMRLISNGNGEIILNSLQKGDYLFQFIGAEQPAGKSINEKGVKRSENAMAKPGSPIGGIVVKGGKNPGGNFINLTVNENGQVGFEVLESGNYKLIIETPSSNSGTSKKVVEKATSGLKDTLKTNV